MREVATLLPAALSYNEGHKYMSINMEPKKQKERENIICVPFNI